MNRQPPHRLLALLAGIGLAAAFGGCLLPADTQESGPADGCPPGILGNATLTEEEEEACDLDADRESVDGFAPEEERAPAPGAPVGAP